MKNKYLPTFVDFVEKVYMKEETEVLDDTAVAVVDEPVDGEEEIEDETEKEEQVASTDGKVVDETEEVEETKDDEEVDSTDGKVVDESKVMSKKDLDKEIAGIRRDLAAEGMPGDQKYDMADAVLDDDSFRDAIKKHYGVSSPVEWLADRI